jgi:hypothetical protein
MMTVEKTQEPLDAEEVTGPRVATVQSIHVSGRACTKSMQTPCILICRRNKVLQTDAQPVNDGPDPGRTARPVLPLVGLFSAKGTISLVVVGH